MARRRLSVITEESGDKQSAERQQQAELIDDFDWRAPPEVVSTVSDASNSDPSLAIPLAGESEGIGISAEELRRMVEREQERTTIIRSYIARNLKSGVDFGSILVGGRESKPSLFKPGAEKICTLLQLRAEFEPDHATLAMAGNTTGLFAYVCRLVDRHGRLMGEGRGASDLGEKRGWTVNNAIKICEKRAQIDAVLRVVGLSEIFTQDLEDAEQRVAMEQEVARRNQQSNTPTNVPQRPAVADPTPAYVAEAPTAPAPAAPRTPAEDLCNDAQEKQIRALLPRAGLSEADLLSSLNITSIRQLPRNRAYRVIDRLAEKAKARG